MNALYRLRADMVYAFQTGRTVCTVNEVDLRLLIAEYDNLRVELDKAKARQCQDCDRCLALDKDLGNAVAADERWRASLALAEGRIAKLTEELETERARNGGYDG